MGHLINATPRYIRKPRYSGKGNSDMKVCAGVAHKNEVAFSMKRSMNVYQYEHQAVNFYLAIQRLELEHYSKINMHAKFSTRLHPMKILGRIRKATLPIIYFRQSEAS